MKKKWLHIVNDAVRFDDVVKCGESTQRAVNADLVRTNLEVRLPLPAR